MPYSIKKQDDKFCVFKQGESDPIKGGCHPDKKEATDHLQALYANEAMAIIAELYSEDPADSEELDEFCDDSLTEAASSHGMEEFPWTGPIVFENVTTGDNRVFKSDSINWQEDTLPWAFRWQKASGQGHAGSVPVGRVDRIERKGDGSIHGYGVVIPSLSDEAAEYLKLLESGAGGGVSVDGDSAQFEVQEVDQGQPRIEFSSMRLRALSAVDIPAFNGARIKLIKDEVPALLSTEALEVTEPEALEDETEVDLETQVAEVEDELVDEVAVMREELARKKRNKKATMKYGWHFDGLTAAAIPVLPSTDAFIEPTFDGPTPLTVTPDGKVFGHLALFNTCHIGFPGTCVKPPKGSNYQYFHTGEIETAEGDLVDVGHLTFKTGHASMQDNPRTAAEHYDNTGAVAADVRAGEDKFGIWVVGALRPSLSDEDIRAFRSAPLSGDWRRIAGKLELVGALAVNTPGFPVPRVKALVASGQTEALFTFLEEDDEGFMSEYELTLRYDKKVELAGRLHSLMAQDEAPVGPVPNKEILDSDVPKLPKKKDIQDRARNYTPDQIKADLKDLRALLDDPDEEIDAKTRHELETVYKAYQKVDLKDFASNLTAAGAEPAVDFMLEFYNQCHGDNGRFCEGPDGAGRVRDNKGVSGRHYVKDAGPRDPRHGTNAGQTQDEHANIEHPLRDRGGKPGGFNPGRKPGGFNPGGKPGGFNPGSGSSDKDRLRKDASTAYSKYKANLNSAFRWAGVGSLMYGLAMHASLAGPLAALSPALANPGVLAIIAVGALANSVRKAAIANGARKDANAFTRKIAIHDKYDRQQEAVRIAKTKALS